MKRNLVRPMLLLVMLVAPLSHSRDDVATSPQAGTRTYAQNYKDMALAECVATAYKSNQRVAVDARSSTSALRDWTS